MWLPKAGGGSTQDPRNASTVRPAPDGTAGFSGITASVIVSLCALAWIAGPLSVVSAALTEQVKTFDCHQTQGHPQNGPGHCSSHCHAIDSQAVDVQDQCSSAAPLGSPSESFRGAFNVCHLYRGVVSRGPPVPPGHRNALIVGSLCLTRETQKRVERIQS